MKISDGVTYYVEKKQPGSSHWLIRHWLAEYKPGTKLLDVGTANGMLGQAIAESGFILTGVEPDRNWAQIARHYYHKFWEGTVEEAAPEIIEGQDVVILADILEHLRSPEGVLKYLFGLQPAGCVFLISVPNIANIFIRFKLLLGRFDYQERGILDRTHLRFFTRRTFFKLLNFTGLEILESKVTPVPLELIHPFFEKSILGRSIYNGLYHLSALFPTLLGYQFVVKAQKPVGKL
jgi:2-polyprenyl-3-methyl-5-hydroxy-6-metoxy-1,4-benzoquinol methylase